MKREAIMSNESKMNDDALHPLIDTMLACRKEAADEINRLFGTNISVEFNSAWEDNEKENEAIMEQIEAAADQADEVAGNDNEIPSDNDDISTDNTDNADNESVDEEVTAETIVEAIETAAEVIAEAITEGDTPDETEGGNE